MRCKIPDRDLQARLDSTICRYRGLPYYVRYAGPGLLNLYALQKVNNRHDADFVINSNDPDFDISTIPMGYVQYTNTLVYYVSRRPQRMYKQGVSADALSFTDLRGGIVSGSAFSKQFENMVMGNYSSLNQVQKAFKDAEVDMELAISRDCALKLNHKIRIVSVFFKNDEVGWMQEGTDTVIVPSSEKGWLVSRYLSQFNWRVQ